MYDSNCSFDDRREWSLEQVSQNNLRAQRRLPLMSQQGPDRFLTLIFQSRSATHLRLAEADRASRT